MKIALTIFCLVALFAISAMSAVEPSPILRIGQWSTEYPSNGVVDGTQWSLNIAYADHVLHTHGNNNYPDDTAKPNRDPEAHEDVQPIPCRRPETTWRPDLSMTKP
jgi:hypothetical protein